MVVSCSKLVLLSLKKNKEKNVVIIAFSNTNDKRGWEQQRGFIAGLDNHERCEPMGTDVKR